jgi:hypothetical protein
VTLSEAVEDRKGAIQHQFSGSDCPDPDVVVHLSMIDAASPWINITAGRHPASFSSCNIKM